MNTQSRHSDRTEGDKRRRALVTTAVAAAVAVVLLVSLMRGVGAQSQQPLTPGAPVAGALTSRFGDAWSLYGCAGDVVTVTAVSTRFFPYIELYAPAAEAPDGAAPDGETPVIEAGGDTTTTVIAGAPLTQTGLYTVALLGDRRSARGPYTLSASFAATPTTSTTPTGGTFSSDDAPDGYLAVGQSVTGTLASRFGDLWQVHLCGAAPVTVTMRATAFAPVIELGADVSGTLATVENPADDAQAEWASIVFTPSFTLDARLNVGGERRSDRGVYTLTVESAAPDALAAVTSSRTPTRTPLQTPTPAAQPTRQTTATPSPIAFPSCRVLVQALRLRSGPGTQYEPPLGGLPLDTTLELLGRSADLGWVNVRVQGSSLTGWVSAAAQYVQCNVPLSGLQVVAAPPTPATAPTNTPIPTPTTPAIVVQPTPTSPAFVVVPGAVPGGNVTGALRTGVGVGRIDNGFMTFTRQMWLFADTVVADGRAVDRVIFHLGSYDYTDEFDFPIDQHLQTERTPRYCLFGGGEPNCTVLNLGAGAVWPSTGRPIVNGMYRVTTEIFLQGDGPEEPSGRWGASIFIESPDLADAAAVEDNPPVDTQLVEPTPTRVAPEEPQPPAELPALQVEAWEFAPGSLDTLIEGHVSFQVAAWDPTVGSNNGDGIESVTLRIYGPNGVVHERTEQTAAYCAFGGGEPDWNAYDYADNGYAWDSGASVETGAHTLTADVVARDGRTESMEWTVDIE